MPRDSFHQIVQGVHKFQRHVYPAMAETFRALEKGQSPSTLFVTCADSRVNPHLLTNTQPGDIFVARSIGNLIPAHGSGDRGTAALIEYAVQVLQVEHLVVCGHSQCGAIKSLLDPHDDATVPRVTEWLHYDDPARAMIQEMAEKAPAHAMLKVATQHNVTAQLTNARTYPAVATAVALGRLELHGWYYDIGSGGVESLDPVRNTFHPLRADA